jgi:hypothetical protein
LPPRRGARPKSNSSTTGAFNRVLAFLLNFTRDEAAARDHLWNIFFKLARDTNDAERSKSLAPQPRSESGEILMT